MRIKLLVILGLLAALYVSMTVGSQSSFATGSSFGVRVDINTDKIRQQSGQQTKKAAPVSQQSLEDEAVEVTDKKAEVKNETKTEAEVAEIIETAGKETAEKTVIETPEDQTDQEINGDASMTQDTEKE